MALELFYRANGGVCVPLPRGPTAGPGRCRWCSRPSLAWVPECRPVRLGFLGSPPTFHAATLLPASPTPCVCVCVCVCVLCGGCRSPGFPCPRRGACNRFRPKKGGDARLRTPVDSSTGVPDTPTPQNPSGPGGLNKKKEGHVSLGARRPRWQRHKLQAP